MKTLKKCALSFALVLMVALCPILMMACGETPSAPTLALENGFKIVYYIGEALDVSGGTLKYTKDGNDESVEIEASMVSGFSTATAGTSEMTITYEGLQVKVSYTVNEYAGEISLQTAFQTEYYKNDALDVSGGKIKYTEKDAQGNVVRETPVDITESMVTNFSTSEVGNNKTMTITYNGCTTQVNYNVKAWELIEGMGYKSANASGKLYMWLNVRSKNELTQSVEVKWYRSSQSAAPESRPGSAGNVDIILSFEAITDSNGNVDHYLVSLEGVTVEAHMINKDTLRVYGTISYDYSYTEEKSIKKLDPSKHELWTLVGAF